MFPFLFQAGMNICTHPLLTILMADTWRCRIVFSLSTTILAYYDTMARNALQPQHYHSDAVIARGVSTALLKSP